MEKKNNEYEIEAQGGEKFPPGHTAEPGLKYSAGRGGEPYPCLSSLPYEAPPTKPQVKPPQLSPPEEQTLTLQTTSGTGPSTPTASSVLVKGHFVRWGHWKGAGLAQNDPREGRQLQTQAGCHLHPYTQCPSSSSQWLWDAPSQALCPRGCLLAALRKRHEDMSLPRKGTGGWQGPSSEAHLNLKTSLSVPCPRDCLRQS